MSIDDSITRTKLLGSQITPTWANNIQDAIAALGSGSNVNVADYVVYNDSGTYEAVNGLTGDVDSSNALAATVLQYCVDHLTGGGKISLRGDEFTTLGEVLVKYPIWFDGAGSGISNPGDGVTEINFGAFPCFRVTNNGTRFSHLQLRGPGYATAGAYGIHYDTTDRNLNQNNSIDDVMMYQVYRGIYASGANHLWDLWVNRLTVNFCTDGIYLDATDKNNCFIEYSLIEGPSNHGIYIDDFDGVQIRDVDVLSPGVDGLYLDKFHGGSQQILGCAFDNCGRYGIHVEPAAPSQAYLDLADNWVSSKSCGMYIKNVDRGTIHGGHLVAVEGGSPTGFLSLYTSTKISVTGVHVLNPCDHAIYDIYLNNASGITITGCVTENSVTDAAYNIEEANGSDYNVMIGNQGGGTTTAVVHVTGANSEEDHNIRW